MVDGTLLVTIGFGEGRVGGHVVIEWPLLSSLKAQSALPLHPSDGKVLRRRYVTIHIQPRMTLSYTMALYMSLRVHHHVTITETILPGHNPYSNTYQQQPPRQGYNHTTHVHQMSITHERETSSNYNITTSI